MKEKLWIEDARFAMRGGCCGGCGSPVIIAEVQLRTKSGESFYVSLAEVDGLPNFACTPESTIDWQMTMDATDEKAEAYQRCIIAGGDTYEDIFEARDPKWFKIFRYLIYIVRCRMCYVTPFIERTRGQVLNSLRIPLSDVEKEWRLDRQDEEQNG